MPRLSRADLEGVLAFLGDAVADERSPAFLDHVTSRLDAGLPAPRGRHREISFDSFDGEFTERDRDVLIVLRPHLARVWEAVRMRRFVDTAPDGNGLTPRQLEILGWVAQGKTNAEIADLLYLSPGTVRKHLDNIYAVLGVHSRAAAAVLAFDGGRAPMH